MKNIRGGIGQDQNEDDEVQDQPDSALNNEPHLETESDKVTFTGGRRTVPVCQDQLGNVEGECRQDAQETESFHHMWLHFDEVKAGRAKMNTARRRTEPKTQAEDIQNSRCLGLTKQRSREGFSILFGNMASAGN
jgi:hypothetical protein